MTEQERAEHLKLQLQRREVRIDYERPTGTPEMRAVCMVYLLQKLSDTALDICRFYDANGAVSGGEADKIGADLNAEQPQEETYQAFHCSLDEWWHELLALRDAWAEKAGIEPGSFA